MKNKEENPGERKENKRQSVEIKAYKFPNYP